MKKFVAFHAPVILWCGLIFFLSSIPGLKISENTWDLLLRKLAHIFEYFVLFLLTHRALTNASPRNLGGNWLAPQIWRGGIQIEGFTLQIQARASLVIAFIFSVLYAASDEFHQRFVPTRSGNFVDLLIDTIGILLAISVLKFYEQKSSYNLR